MTSLEDKQPADCKNIATDNEDQEILNSYPKVDLEDDNARSVKRKKRSEKEVSLQDVVEVFLRIIYPLSKCMGKSIMIGLFKSLDFTPAIVLNQNGQMIVFTTTAWDSFNEHMQLIQCYLTNKVNGRKTNIRLEGSDIEVEIVKQRGVQCVRVRDLVKHDDKILLNHEEFCMLRSTSHAVNRYLHQLIHSGPIIKDYLLDAIDKQPNTPLIPGPIDASIYNRLPYEVHLYRSMTALISKLQNIKPTNILDESEAETIDAIDNGESTSELTKIEKEV